MTSNIQQHLIPRVYLKHFQIDGDSNKSFVYCIDFANKHNLKPQRKGINDKIFTGKKFYNDKRLSDPFAIEDTLGKVFEPQYENIIKAISKETSPPAETVKNLMAWLYISKVRSPYMRSSIQESLSWIFDTVNKYKKHVPNEIEREKLHKYPKDSSREAHLNYFADEKLVSELLKNHFDTLNAKHWRILKSQPNFPFWTNDNPGFSLNLHPLDPKESQFHPVMELNSDSIIYYVLTPKYCLEITPFEQGTPLTICAFNMNIKFEFASFPLIDFINEGVFYTRHKLLISNSIELLRRCVNAKR